MKWFDEKGERIYSNECDSVDGEIYMVMNNVAIMIPGDSGIEELYNWFIEKTKPIYSGSNLYVAVEANSEESGKYHVYDINQFEIGWHVGIRHQDPVFSNVGTLIGIKNLLLKRHVPVGVCFSKDIKEYDSELKRAKEEGSSFALVCNHCFKVFMTDKEYYKHVHEGGIKPGTDAICPLCGIKVVKKFFNNKEEIKYDKE